MSTHTKNCMWSNNKLVWPLASIVGGVKNEERRNLDNEWMKQMKQRDEFNKSIVMLRENGHFKLMSLTGNCLMCLCELIVNEAPLMAGKTWQWTIYRNKAASKFSDNIFLFIPNRNFGAAMYGSYKLNGTWRVFGHSKGPCTCLLS